jgi:predicted metal-dependent peptidase
VIYFDSKVLRVDSFNEGDQVELELLGGGGTNFAPIFESIGKMNDLPVACVILTDLESNDFGRPPDCPVLWANYGDQKLTAPFGEIALLEGSAK